MYVWTHQAFFCLGNFFFLIFFYFKLYITVLVLPNIKMNLPQVYKKFVFSFAWVILPPDIFTTLSFLLNLCLNDTFSVSPSQTILCKIVKPHPDIPYLFSDFIFIHSPYSMWCYFNDLLSVSLHQNIKTINVEIFVSIFHCYTLSAWNSAWNIRDKQKKCLLNEWIKERKKNYIFFVCARLNIWERIYLW